MKTEYEYILEVFKTGSFSKAAQNLFITQPALSIAIKKIEKDIHMPLFDRSHKPLTLTPAGKIFITNILQMKELEKQSDPFHPRLRQFGKRRTTPCWDSVS